MTVLSENSSANLAVAPDEPMCLLQITDTHLCTAAYDRQLSENNLAGFNAVLALARQRHWPPHALLLTGDLVQDDPDAYPLLRGALDALDVPTLLIAGNHDARDALHRQLAGPGLQVEGGLLAGNWQIIMLNTALAGAKHGVLDAAELQRLERTLRAHPERHALVCLHHQPVPVGSRWLDRIGLRDPEALFAILEQHSQVRALLWGHVHQEYAALRDGIRLLSTPSTCVQFLPASDDYALDITAGPGYRWLTLYPDGRLDTGVVRISGNP